MLTLWDRVCATKSARQGGLGKIAAAGRSCCSRCAINAWAEPASSRRQAASLQPSTVGHSPQQLEKPLLRGPKGLPHVRLCARGCTTGAAWHAWHACATSRHQAPAGGVPPLAAASTQAVQAVQPRERQAGSTASFASPATAITSALRRSCHSCAAASYAATCAKLSRHSSSENSASLQGSPRRGSAGAPRIGGGAGTSWAARNSGNWHRQPGLQGPTARGPAVPLGMPQVSAARHGTRRAPHPPEGEPSADVKAVPFELHGQHLCRQARVPGVRVGPGASSERLFGGATVSTSQSSSCGTQREGVPGRSGPLKPAPARRACRAARRHVAGRTPAAPAPPPET